MLADDTPHRPVVCSPVHERGYRGSGTIGMTIHAAG
jgi:hypothetical protein